MTPKAQAKALGLHHAPYTEGDTRCRDCRFSAPSMDSVGRCRKGPGIAFECWNDASSNYRQEIDPGDSCSHATRRHADAN